MVRSHYKEADADISIVFSSDTAREALNGNFAAIGNNDVSLMDEIVPREEVEESEGIGSDSICVNLK